MLIKQYQTIFWGFDGDIKDMGKAVIEGLDSPKEVSEFLLYSKKQY